MSDLRIGLVAEGPTDLVVIEAAVQSTLQGRPFVITQIQPEESIAFGPAGTGWVGVYRWCHQSADRGGGRMRDDALTFQQYDILILHLDADVADYHYAQGAIKPSPTDGDLPCALNCPPASDTTNALRQVLLSWSGETETPDRTVVCMPSRSTEAWVVASLFPQDLSIKQGIECYPNPEGRLSQQKKTNRLQKTRKDYLARADNIREAWPRLSGKEGLSEAARFERDITAAMPQS